MSILGVIPDIHDQIDLAQQIMDNEQVDRWILLGDYFDNFHTGTPEAKATAVWLKKVLSQDNVIALLGNHDLSYLWPGYHSCSGWAKSKSQVIHSQLSLADWAKLYLVYQKDGWTFTHAGIDQRLGGFKEIKDFEYDFLTGIDLGYEIQHPILAAGIESGGDYPFGGICWARPENFQPVPGLRQIFGHTPGKKPIYNSVTAPCSDMTDTETWCLDTAMKHYMIINDGEVTIHQVTQ